MRYTSNWKGSFEGWLWTPKIGLGVLRKTLPGLRNFYMAGHWVEPGGGLPTALKSGRDVAQIICRKQEDVHYLGILTLWQSVLMGVRGPNRSLKKLQVRPRLTTAGIPRLVFCPAKLGFVQQHLMA